MKTPIILASKSPRRKQLLELAEIPFEIIAKETDESYPDGLSWTEIPVHIAVNKAKVIQDSFPERTILSADTIVVLNNQIFGKPNSQEEAIEFLSRLSGATHSVISGVCILTPNRTITFYDLTQVTFHTLQKQEIEYYVKTYKPLDKAGAYAIQEWIGAVGIQKIEGCFYNVMGLPVSRVKQALSEIKEIDT